MQQRTLRRNPAAEALAGELLDSDWPRQVLEEMAESAADGGPPKEAGRSACGGLDDVREPTERGTFYIEPATCGNATPSGLLHTHPNEPLNPQHSLPDVGLVAFGHFDTSIVVGAETSHVLVSPEDRASLLLSLREAMQMDVQDMEDLWRSRDGLGPAEAEEMRRRLEDYIGPLSRRVDTAVPAVAGDLSTATSPGVSAAAVATGAPEGVVTGGACQCIRDTARMAASDMSDASGGINVREIVVGTVIGDLASVAVQEFVLGGR